MGTNNDCHMAETPAPVADTFSFQICNQPRLASAPSLIFYWHHKHNIATYIPAKNNWLSGSVFLFFSKTVLEADFFFKYY